MRCTLATMKNIIRHSKGVVRFSLKDSRNHLLKNRNKTSLIFLIFSYGGQRLKYSTGFSVYLDDWDFTRRRIKTNKLTIVNPRTVNNFLNKLETGLLDEYSKLILDQQQISKSDIRNILDTISGKERFCSRHKINFIEFSKQVREEKRRTNVAGKETLKIYQQTINKLEEYVGRKNLCAEFESINRSFIIGFKEFLEKDHNLALNTIDKLFKKFKTIASEAHSRGMMSSLPLKLFKVGAEETSAIYLSEKEIEDFHGIDLSFNPRLELARDLFLIGCYTGQRVSDYNGITNENIVEDDGIKFFKIQQKKGKQIVFCPITKKIRSILERYSNAPPPFLHDTDINENIKIIGKMLGLNQNVKKVITKGGKKVTKYFPKWKMIGTHTGRRSFCTNMYKKKVPIHYIMHFSGHKSEREFLKYIRIKDQEHSKHIIAQGYFDI